MLKKAFIALSLTAIGAVSVFAQSSGDDIKKAEFYVGYSNGQIDTGVDSGDSAVDFFRDRENFNGVNVSGVYNVSRYFGVKGDMSAAFNSKRFSGETTIGGDVVRIGVKNSNQLYNFTGGVQVKDNAKSGVFKPFAHAMVGVAHARLKISDYTCTPTADCPITSFPDDTITETGFSGIIGGGIDFRINNKIQIRAIQVDYNPTRLGGETQNNVRIGAGIVF